MEDQIVTIWLPVAVTLVFGVVGLVRGAGREAVMAASVVLAAYINREWGGQWGPGLHDLFKGMDQGQEQFALSTAVLWLIVLGLGYGLGTVLPKERPVRASRIGGGLLGLASGAAVAGLMLRYAYTGLDGTDTSSRFYQNPVSFSFMVWAVWYPLVLAFVGAVLVLVVPIRRAQRAVAQPSAASDWSPPPADAQTPPRTPAPAMASTMFVPAGAGSATSPPADAHAPTAPYPVNSQQTVAMPAVDAPPTTPMPVEPAQGAPPTGSSMSANEDLSATRAFSDVMAPSPSPLQPATPLPATESDAGGADTPGTFSLPGSSDSSWLLQPVEDDKQGAVAEASLRSEPPAQPRPPEDQQPRPMMAITSFGTERAIPSSPPKVDKGDAASPAQGDGKCPNCGAAVMQGASFCTECGTRIQ